MRSYSSPRSSFFAAVRSASSGVVGMRVLAALICFGGPCRSQPADSCDTKPTSLKGQRCVMSHQMIRHITVWEVWTVNSAVSPLSLCHRCLLFLRLLANRKTGAPALEAPAPYL